MKSKPTRKRNMARNISGNNKVPIAVIFSPHSLIYSRCTKNHFVSKNQVQLIMTPSAHELKLGALTATNASKFLRVVAGRSAEYVGTRMTLKYVCNTREFVQEVHEKQEK